MPKAELNQIIQDEILRIASSSSVDSETLEKFAYFVIENHRKKAKVAKAKSSTAKKPSVDKAKKPLTLTQLKNEVYKYFDVKDTTELKRSGSFKMATDGMDELNLRVKEGWEILYRKFIGVLPGEENQKGYGCINGVNIFNYFMPWKVFGLDPQTATPDDVKQAYRNLSKTYHPDIPETGDAKIFDRINVMYKSISAEA